MAKKHQFEEFTKNEVDAFDATMIRTARAAEAAEIRTVAKSREYWNILGPGLTTGAADDDPSGIATYSQTGAQFGFQLL